MGKVWRKRKWRWFRQGLVLFFVALFAVTSTEASSDRKKRYGELCHYNQDCDTDLFLKCDRGMCLCENEENSILENGQCRVLADQSCTENPFCVQDAQCLKGRCECFKPMFMSLSNGSCLLAPGARCDNSVPCNPEGPLDCVNEICSCPPLQTYSWKARKCLGLIGASCNPTSSSRTCIDNAVCTLTYNGGVCKCSPQFTPTHTNSCSLRFGENCMRTENEDDTVTQCNSDDFLHCSDRTGKCECMYPNQMIFEGMKGKRGECRLLVGEPCHHPNSSVANGPDPLQCVTGSRCNATETQQGTCLCNRGFRETKTKTCDASKATGDSILKCILSRKGRVCVCGEGFIWMNSVCTRNLRFPSFSSSPRTQFIHFTLLIFTLSCLILFYKHTLDELSNILPLL